MGSAIARALAAHGWRISDREAADWTDSTRLADGLAGLLTRSSSPAISAEAPIQRGGRSGPTVIWAAGQAGFGADEAQTSAELEFFGAAMEGIRDRLNEHLHVVLLSSAGGLHEGRSYVAHAKDLAVCRPYGVLKLEQEHVVNRLFSAPTIYRVSSVFGPRRPTMRRSLISELLDNGSSRRFTVVTGDRTTLRDYVFSEDLGHAVAAGIGCHPRTEYLISSRPVSISEAVAVAQRILRRPILVRYDAPVNNASITFAPSLRAQALRQTPLTIAMTQMLLWDPHHARDPRHDSTLRAAAK